MKQVEVVAAVIQIGDSILCVQRNTNKFEYISLKYEFPGGKIEPGETREDAIKREINEELRMDIDIKSYLMTVKHTYPDFELTMHAFLCSSKTASPTLTEHVDFKWLTKDNLSNLDWAAADVPIVEKLIQS